MLNNTLIIETIILILMVMSFICGYLTGKSTTPTHSVEHSANSWFSSKHQPLVNNNLKIDDKKFVTEIKTDNLEKKYDSLGETKTSLDNISESVNKLKSLKG
jgi:hypothetical protein